MSSSSPKPVPSLVGALQRVSSTASTNQDLKELARSGAPVGTAILARSQTHGRGRADHTWASPPGGVYLSVLLAPHAAGQLTDLPLLAGVAMIQCVQHYLPATVQTTLKWPNDVLVQKKKIGGILCEGAQSVANGGGALPDLGIVGMGLNVSIPAAALEPFQNNPFPPTTLESESFAQVFDVDAVAVRLLEDLEKVYAAYLAQGFGWVRQRWEQNCAFIGKQVEISVSEGSRLKGRFLGLDEQGALVMAVGTPGERRRFLSGEITCFWQ